MSNPMQTATQDASNAVWGPNFQVYSNTQAAIVWGTEGITNQWANYIVTSASSSQRISEIPIMQGAGFTAILILLMDGIDVEVEVIDDTNVQPPVIGGGPYYLVTPFGTFPMALTESKSNQAPKREGHRNFTFKSFIAITAIN